MSKEKEYYIDYRFIVKASNINTANEILSSFLPDSTDSIWYTIIKKQEKKHV